MTKIGRIYKIICSQSDDVYIGSTFNELRVRFSQHKNLYDSWSEGKTNKCSIYPIIEKYGIDKFKIILISEYNVVDKHHLHAYEQLWINKTRCVNEINPLYFKKLRQKDYAKNNKEKITEYKKQYNDTNQETIKVKRKQYRESNKEAIKAKKSEKVQCGCGVEHTRSHKARHEKSKTHQTWLSSQ